MLVSERVHRKLYHVLNSQSSVEDVDTVDGARIHRLDVQNLVRFRIKYQPQLVERISEPSTISTSGNYQLISENSSSSASSINTSHWENITDRRAQRQGMPLIYPYSS